MTALGSIVKTYPHQDPYYCIKNGLLDYFDDWFEIDPRIAAFRRLSIASDVFAHDIINIATYVDQILDFTSEEKKNKATSVIYIASMTEALLMSLRSGYDVVASALSQVIAMKPGQAPANSFHSQMTWVRKNQKRVPNSVANFFSQNFSEFYELRRFRDEVSHNGAHPTIGGDGIFFYLILQNGERWITDRPLLPLIHSHIIALFDVANSAALVINEEIALPRDRVGCRAAEGLLVRSIHDLARVQMEQMQGPTAFFKRPS